GIFYDKRYLEPVSVAFDTETHSTWKEVQAQLDFANGGSDLRDLYWPAAMLTDENLAKYGVSHVFAQYNDDLDAGTYIHGMKFNGERIFTATYTVKEDVPEGTELEFFVPENVTLSMEDFLYNENNEKFAVWDFTHVVYEGTVDSQKFITTDNYRKIGQTVTANTATVTVGEEVVVEPEVKGDIVDIYTSAAFVGETTAVDVEVTGTPDILRVVSAEGTSVFTREDATIVPFNGNELWTIELLPVAEYTEYTVYADYGELGVTDGKTFYITAEVKADLGIHSIEIPDMYPNAQNGGVITAGKHDIIIKTSTDVVKVQFYDPADGTTYTYTSWSGAGKVPYEDIDGERVWTISHAFGPFGTNSLVIRTRSATTFFAATESTLDATVVY
ncbi:MAG: hypothetical protein IKT61_02035, partial [Clostridia bacterium]|nr:hypothetical protein [Clostridia bacterium]